MRTFHLHRDSWREIQGCRYKNSSAHLFSISTKISFGKPDEPSFVAATKPHHFSDSTILLTAAKFVHNPFNGQPGERLYRTGDLTRYLPDGAIEFLGRIDNQVKIAGHRIEPGEIETVLGQHPGVRQAVVVARAEGPGEQRLVAYLAPNGEAASAGEIREFLRSKLPDYMVPSAIVWIDAYPLSPNGKVDRAALPAPDALRSETVSPALPQTDLEQTIGQVWQEVLGNVAVGLDDNFFDLGGDSLYLIEVHSLLRKRIAFELTVTDLFQFTTVRALAGQLTKGAAAQPAFSEASDRARKQKEAQARFKQKKAESGR